MLNNNVIINLVNLWDTNRHGGDQELSGKFVRIKVTFLFRFANGFPLYNFTPFCPL